MIDDGWWCSFIAYIFQFFVMQLLTQSIHPDTPLWMAEKKWVHIQLEFKLTPISKGSYGSQWNPSFQTIFGAGGYKLKPHF